MYVRIYSCLRAVLRVCTDEHCMSALRVVQGTRNTHRHTPVHVYLQSFHMVVLALSYALLTSRTLVLAARDSWWLGLPSRSCTCVCARVHACTHAHMHTRTRVSLIHGEGLTYTHPSHSRRGQMLLALFPVLLQGALPLHGELGPVRRRRRPADDPRARASTGARGGYARGRGQG